MPSVRRLLRSVCRWQAVAIMLALVFVLSSIPNVGEPRGDVLVPWDKVAHFCEYAALAFVFAGAVRRQTAGRVPLVALLAVTAAFGALYGVTDELHQRFVPGRDPAVSDWLADVAGTAAGASASVVLLPAAAFRRDGG
jgi:VanZ family protein